MYSKYFWKNTFDFFILFSNNIFVFFQNMLLTWKDFANFLSIIDDTNIYKICQIPEKLKEDVISESKNFSKKRSIIEQIIKFIDLTTLLGDDTKSRIDNLVNSAINPIKDNSQIKCASVCVYPARILDACNAIKSNGSSMNVASVACGFPSGQYHIESRLLEVKLAIRDGATEIDAVINRSAVLECNWELLFEEIEKIRNVTKGAKLKIILSVGELGTDKAIYLTSMLAMYAGADFIKTSTGKETVNATLESAYIMCLAIDHFYKKTNKLIGFKAAGGIRSVEQALQYMILVEKILGKDYLDPKFFRIGASIGLLENIRKRLYEEI